MGASSSKTSDKGSLYDCEGQVCDFLQVSKRCYARQLAVAAALRELADELDNIERQTMQAETGLVATGIVLSAVGIGLSFVTLGSSLVLTAVGGALGGAAATGTVVATIVEKVLKEKKMKVANQAVQSYIESVIEYVPHLQRFCESLSSDAERERMYAVLRLSGESEFEVTGVKSKEKLCEACSIGHKIVSTWERVEEAVGLKGEKGGVTGKDVDTVASFSLSMLSNASTLSEKTVKTIAPLANGIRLGSHVLTGVGLILDIGTIIYNSIKLHQRKPSEVAELLRKIANALES